MASSVPSPPSSAQTLLGRTLYISDQLPGSGQPVVFQPKTKEVSRDDKNKIVSHHLWPEHEGPDRYATSRKVLMLVGATGAGKTTLINGIVNYVCGVKWQDNCRIKLIVDEEDNECSSQKKSQAHSQTQFISAYTLHKQNGSSVPYTLTIVDTPGFGDTAGLERDKELTAQIKEFFSLPPPKGIDQLDAVCFVAQSSSSRLTPTQRYIFDSILSIFGKDIKDNIFMITTFADARKPKVLEAIKEADIPYVSYFKFNNSALYAGEEDMDEEDEEEDDDGSPNSISEMYWSMGVKSFKKFFNFLDKVTPQSLQLTNEVLQERKRLETLVAGLLPQIRSGMCKIDEMQQDEMIMKKHEADIIANKNFTVKTMIHKQRKIDLKGTGIYVTNCLECNYTCHDNCAYADDRDKYRCSAMAEGAGTQAAKCGVCKNKCHWTKHVNNPYRFELYMDEMEQTSEELKKKYFQAKKEKQTVETMVEKCRDELKMVDSNVQEMIKRAQQSIKRLEEIALKSNPLSEVEYIDLLIESEKQEAKPRWRERVKYLEKARKQAELTAKIKGGDSSLPWSEILL